MPEPETLGRVDWMPRLKVWRVIWYKGAADIPAGDYPTKEEAEDALRELVARGNPGDTPEVTLYHGTTLEKATNIQSSGFRQGEGDKAFGRGIYLAEEQKSAHLYGEKVLPVEIQVTNPYELNFTDPESIRDYMKLSGETSPDFKDWDTRSIAETLKRQGYDAAHLIADPAKLTGEELDLIGVAHQWLVFDPENVRLKVAIPKASGNPGFTPEEAKSIGEKLGIDFKGYDVAQFKQGLNVELEHCNVTNCDPLLTGKIAQAHLNELPDYYTRLAKMEKGGNPPMYVCAYCKQEVKEGTIHHCPGADAEREARQISEGGSLEQKANALLPMTPEEGPPLPRALKIRWPWKK